MKSKILKICLCINGMLAILPSHVISPVQAQPDDINKYWIGLRDKDFNTYSLDRPGEFLSPRALLRRNQQHIPLVKTDLPVSQYYLDSLLSFDIRYYYHSRWFNGLVCGIQDSATLEKINQVSFVRSVRLIYSPRREQTLKKMAGTDYQKWSEYFFNAWFNYGKSRDQITLINGTGLHARNFLGRGKMIAVLDAGFYKVDTFPAFDSLRTRQQIAGTKDFVDHDRQVYDAHPHGMMVLSIMGGNVDGRMVGTAPQATYLLLRSEDAASEQLIEEYNWLAAAEYADSLGADIINSSLGYYQFDHAFFNHSYASLDGNTAVVTRAADIAASKGILVVSSAGNEGNDPWKYIIAPADGDSVLSVGAVDTNRIPAAFTSWGPRTDGAVKPNVAALGRNVFLQHANAGYGYGSGTSFSSPAVAGMAACLWEAWPELTNMNVFESIEQSGDRYHSPGNLTGYGIPDFMKAHAFIESLIGASQKEFSLHVYPTLFEDEINVGFYSEKKAPFEIRLYNMSGELLFRHQAEEINRQMHSIKINPPDQLHPGMYILHVRIHRQSESKKLIKLH